MGVGVGGEGGALFPPKSMEWEKTSISMTLPIAFATDFGGVC